MRTLRDRLSRLNYARASRLLGVEGQRLIRLGGALQIDLESQVQQTSTRFALDLVDAKVTIVADSRVDHSLDLSCSACHVPCEHLGAAMSLILEEKLALGLATPPVDRTPIESLSPEELIEEAIRERSERAFTEKLRLRATDPKVLWSDYIITSHLSGKTYRVALRGWERGDSYCDCPDFKRNKLGTCKHILYALKRAEGRFAASERRTPYRRQRLCLALHYGQHLELRLLLPDSTLERGVDRLVRPFANRPVENVAELVRMLRKLDALEVPVNIYPDAQEHIDRWLFNRHINSTVEDIRRDPVNHPLRKTLLKADLLPYQLDGIAFAVGAGRSVLADDMGLGKTIQGIGVATLLQREVGIARTLVICPTSLKSQWQSEIHRFSALEVQLIAGSAEERAAQYNGPAFFTIANYEQVLRDIESIETVKWDLIILDEGQRIKNWEAKTSRVVKGLVSRYALVLSGTPLENRLDDLYSVVEFVDPRRLGPSFEFYNTYRMTDETGRVLGYKNLERLRRELKPVLLRRTRKMVLAELPPRTTEIIKIVPTEEQMSLHDAHKRIVASVIAKRYISEMDLLRLQKALLMCRLAANSSYLVDKQEPGFSSKLQAIDALLADLGEEEDRKMVLFSEWTTMLDLIEPLVAKHGIDRVRLDGSVPQKMRAELIHAFNRNPGCRLFMTSNAGATGLNLQAANTVINVDLPWNPAILEQRISRVHRMGQARPVQVFVLVSEGTLEEGLLQTLSAKHQLALAALDPEASVSEVSMQSGIEELRRRLEVLLGKPADAPIDERTRQAKLAETKRLDQKQRMAAAGGHLLTSAFAFLAEMLPRSSDGPAVERLSGELGKSLRECLEPSPAGGVQLTVTLPDEKALDGLASALAGFLAARNAP